MIITVFENPGREFGEPIQIEHEDGVFYSAYDLDGNFIRTNCMQESKAQELIEEYHRDMRIHEAELRRDL